MGSSRRRGRCAVLQAGRHLGQGLLAYLPLSGNPSVAWIGLDWDLNQPVSTDINGKGTPRHRKSKPTRCSASCLPKTSDSSKTCRICNSRVEHFQRLKSLQVETLKLAVDPVFKVSRSQGLKAHHPLVLHILLQDV